MQAKGDLVEEGLDARLMPARWAATVARPVTCTSAGGTTPTMPK